MGVLKRVQRTKTQKGKRALEEREPKAVENTKTALFVRGTNCSDKVMKCMKGMRAIHVMRHTRSPSGNSAIQMEHVSVSSK